MTARDMEELNLYERYKVIMGVRKVSFFPEELILIDEDVMERLGIEVTITTVE